MAAVINTNIASLNTQRNLGMSQSALNTSIQRLSSGLRVNTAKDDAAGLAISERMTSQIRGLNQAARNANDGISLAQTAEGALGKVGDMLQRVRELAVQSANATNSDSDRVALNDEATQLKAEIQRLAEQTSFNGTKLLDGMFSNQAFQVGANQGETITVSAIANSNISALGSWTSIDQAATPVAGAAPAGTAAVAATPATKAMGALTASAGGDGTSILTTTFTDGTNSLNVAVTGPVTAASLATAYETAGFAADGTGTVSGYTLNLGAATTISAAITAGSLTVERADGANFTYAEAETGTAYTTSGGFNAAPTAATTDGVALDAGGSFTALSGAAFTINGTNIEVGTAADAATRLSDLVTAINAQTTAGAATGVSAAVADGKLTLTGTAGVNGGNITIGGTTAAVVLAQTGLTSAANAGTTGSAQTGFSGLDISSVDGANNALLAMDAALNSVNSNRATLGALQSRFESVVSSIQIQSENLSSARSRIVDTDFAAETAALTRGQILQQAGTAMLAQANSLPNNVLSLLRG